MHLLVGNSGRGIILRISKVTGKLHWWVIDNIIIEAKSVLKPADPTEDIIAHDPACKLKRIYPMPVLGQSLCTNETDPLTVFIVTEWKSFSCSFSSLDSFTQWATDCIRFFLVNQYNV